MEFLKFEKINILFLSPYSRPKYINKIMNELIFQF